MKKVVMLLFTAVMGFVLFSGVFQQSFGEETDEFTLEEITVTAQKRDENQQKVAIAMDVVADEAHRTGGEDGDGLRVEGVVGLLDGLLQLLFSAEDNLRVLHVGGEAVGHEVVVFDYKPEAVQELVANSRTSRASGDYAHALSDIERAIRIEPRNPYLWIELGEIYLLQDDPQRAASMARKAMSVAGDNRAAKVAAESLLERASGI